MKRTKKIIVLCIILIVISIATFAVTKYQKKVEKIHNSDSIIMEISTETVKSLSWKDENNEMAFHKDNDMWLYNEDETFPVNQEKITEILSHFEALGVSFIIESVEDYGQYGLDDPEGVIYISTTEKDYELKIGNFSKMDEKRYIDIGDGNVYLVSEDPTDYIEENLSDMILNDEIPELENIVDIKYSGLENYTINYIENSSNTYSKEDTYFTEKDNTIVPLDTNKIETYLNTISSLSLKDYVTYNVTEEELAQYGLNEPELSISVTYKYNDENNNEKNDTCVLNISRNIEELKNAEEAEANNEENIPNVTKYIRVGDSKIVYKLNNSSYNTLVEASYNDLRHKEIIWADSDIITQIDINLEGENHVLTSNIDENNEEKRIWYYGGKEIDISELETALEELSADEFISEYENQKEEINLTVYLDNEKFPQIKIQIYRYDGKSCVAVVDGKSISLVSRSDVMDLIEAVQAIVLN